MKSLRIFILGGYGTFGTRLVRLLSGEKDLTIICAGRSIDKYGDRPYRVVEAAIAAGIDYVDLADGADFVAGILAYDDPAKASGVSVISGASTFPALSSAVVQELSKDWQNVEHIESGLAPSPRAGLGRNVVAAIMSYAGKPVPVIIDRRSQTAPALINSRRFVIAPPGIEPLPHMKFSLVALPDQAIFPAQWPQLRELWPGVGTRPQFMLRFLNLCSRAVQYRLLSSLSPLSGIAFRAVQMLPWGAHRGGLIVRVGGTDATGAQAIREWHMIAEGDHGPFIPSMAVAALVKNIGNGNNPSPGARTALGVFSLAHFEAQFSDKQIMAGIREKLPKDAPLYHHVLGEAWSRLSPEIRALHTDPDGRVVTGRARVDRGRSPLARLIAAIVGFPKESDDVPVEVRFTVKDGEELWQRKFDGRPFSSVQKRGTGSFEHLISESFGPLEFGLALVLKDDKMWLKTLGWRAFGIPMPRFLAPSGDAYEDVVDGRFNFHVEIRHWMTGLIVHYRGWLE